MGAELLSLVLHGTAISHPGKADFEAGRKIECPVAVYWGELSHTEKFFSPREAWPRYASNIVKLKPLPCGHYPAEQVPDIVYDELREFFKP